MKHDQFDGIVKRRLKIIKELLLSKGQEYGAEDRLHNFKRGAAIEQCTPEQSCVGYMMKHLVSVLDIVDEIATGKMDGKFQKFDEKIGDLCNYVILLEALLVERHESL